MIELMNETQYGRIELGKIYALVLRVSGREHNILLKDVQGDYLFGDVAQVRFATFHRPKSSGSPVLDILPRERAADLHKTENVILEAPCLVPSLSLRMRVRCEEVAVIEDPWMACLPAGVVSADGTIADAKAFVEAMPQFAAFQRPDGMFVENPSVWPQFRMVEPGAQDDANESTEGEK